MYTRKNYKSAKQVKLDVVAGLDVQVFQPGPFGPNAKDGLCCLEGPHYPQPHSWYLEVVVKDGKVESFTGMTKAQKAARVQAKQIDLGVLSPS